MLGETKAGVLHSSSPCERDGAHKSYKPCVRTFDWVFPKHLYSHKSFSCCNRNVSARHKLADTLIAISKRVG